MSSILNRIQITESTGHGKNVAGNKKTSTIQVRDYGAIQDAYLLLKQFRFTVDDITSREKAVTRANRFANSLRIQTLTEKQ